MQYTNINIMSLFLFITISLSFSILLYFFYKKREKLKQKYVLLFNQNKSFYLGYIFLFLSLFFLLFSIFGIKYGENSSKNEINGIDIVFVLDVSKSMNALDFEDSKYNISRLDFSKKLISDYISNNTENRYGLVIFAGDAISSVPLTNDNSAFMTFLKNVDYRNLNEQGTNLEKAIELGVNRLQLDNGENDRAKSIILISDGGDEGDKIDFDYISSFIKDKKITNFVIGIGKTSGAKIPIGQDAFGRISYQKYNGNEVITKLNSSSLKNLAKSLNGEFVIVNDINDLDSLQNDLNNLEKKSIKIEGISSMKDFSRFLAILSLLFFILYLFYKSRK